MATTVELEKKVEQLASELHSLQDKVEKIAPGTDWRSMAGWAKDDPIYDQAMEAGAKYRTRMNAESLEGSNGETDAGS
ncbi:MAG: hypothetical protein ACI9OD_003888 [Limisphaerales bacterium]|jgi:hypothetical protein